MKMKYEMEKAKIDAIMNLLSVLNEKQLNALKGFIAPVELKLSEELVPTKTED